MVSSGPEPAMHFAQRESKAASGSGAITNGDSVKQIKGGDAVVQADIDRDGIADMGIIILQDLSESAALTAGGFIL
jgi:hypothetical protein